MADFVVCPHRGNCRGEGNYACDVQNLLPEDGKVSLDYIRRVKLFRIKNAPIMIALYRVAQWNLLQKQTN